MTTLIEIQQEVEREIGNKETFTALVQTTFKGLDGSLVKKAIMEGMMRGFTFKDFLEKNVYAIPYGQTYSLVTSIDYARKIGMRSGVVGKSEPVYETDAEGKKIIACSVTIKRKVNDYVGDYTAKVYFQEYTTNRNLWTSKPRTMIAKVAEMHALRSACPEEMSQVYVEEEMEKDVVGAKLEPIDIKECEKKLNSATTLAELKTIWSALPQEAKSKLEEIKNQIKQTLN